MTTNPPEPISLHVPETIHFSNGIRLELLLTSDGLFQGIGRVSYQDRLLRDDSVPWNFYTETEGFDGAWRFESFRLRDITQTEEECHLFFDSEGTWMPRIQNADAMGDARIKTRRLQRPIAAFHWSLRTITEKIWENTWSGLSMRLEVESVGWPIHWILESTTWEIDGTAEGCVLIQQDVSTIDLEQKVKRESAFSTIERFVNGADDAWGGSYPMDMLPRAAGAAICDFQAKDDLALCLYAPKPGLIRARLEKFADEQVIHYLDRPFIPLTEHAVFPERRLLVYQHSQPFQQHEWRNLWLDCFTHTREVICGNYDFIPEVPRPSVHAHLWDNDLRHLGATWLNALRDALPKIRQLGYKEVFTHGVWESITSDTRPNLTGNICCPYNFRFAEAFGGSEGMRALVAEARKNGVDLFQWFSFHFSSGSPIWTEHPDWILREANGDPWDGAYRTIWSGRLRSPYGEWFRSQILDVQRDTVMPGIFWDSYQNLGVTCIDWSAPDKAPQAEEIWRLQADLQRSGMKQKCEVVTIFGVSQVCMFGFEQDTSRRRLWVDTVRNDDAFVLLDCSPAFFSSVYPFTRERVGPELYFWLAAHRTVPTIPARPWGPLVTPEAVEPLLPGGELAEEYARVNHLYEQALPLMKRLRMQRGGDWVLWLDGEGRPAIIWSFRETTIPWKGGIVDLESGEKLQAIGGEIRLRSGAVYQVQG